MERGLLFLTTLTIGSCALAQLAPTTDAPLVQHLLEVNKEWRTMDPSPEDGARIVHFTNEAERIATHLHMVRAYLHAHASADLSPAARAEREALLGKLDAYADRGLFPQNDALPYRNPVFIDRHNTACAVGQLMIESGNGSLARRIQHDMNLAYVHDMKRDDVFAWASTSGFTENELAWIQPGYPPSTTWYGLGDGTNGPVSELLRLTNGDLIVAGTFTQAGNVPCTRVARWDGSVYHTMGSPLEGEVTCAIESGGSVILGGSFSAGAYDLLTWNGSAWTASAAFASKFAQVTALHEHEGTLYAAGATSGFSGTSYGVQMFMGGIWMPVGQQLNGPIHALGSLNGDLVCGGAFTGNYLSPDTTAEHVAVLNGNTWQQLGDGLNGTVYDMLVDQGQLYAGGDCVGEIVVRFGLARIAAGAGAWEQLMPNLGNYINSPLDALVSINALVAHEGRIYFGGDFGIVSGLTWGFGIGVFNGAPDDVGVMADLNGPVNDLELIADHTLVSGGLFTANTGLSVPYIGTTDLVMGVPVSTVADGALELWPDPATEQVNVRFATDAHGTATLLLIDAAGRQVRTITVTGSRCTIDVRDLAPGNYTLRTDLNGTIVSARFLKR